MKLSVNLNKIALLRNSRGAFLPSMLQAAQTVIDAGADGITLHWREDNRHTRKNDVYELRALCAERDVEFNLEGDVRDELVALALEITPTQLTLVPVTPGEVTSDHGWTLPAETELLAPVVARAQKQGIRVSLFVDPNAEVVAHVPQTGAQRIEIYTEPYAAAFGTARQTIELERLQKAATEAERLGLGVNAGHDLNVPNTTLLAQAVPQILEVSIGHALVNDALYHGLAATVRAYKNATNAGTQHVGYAR